MNSVHTVAGLVVEVVVVVYVVTVVVIVEVMAVLEVKDGRGCKDFFPIIMMMTILMIFFLFSAWSKLWSL